VVLILESPGRGCPAYRTQPSPVLRTEQTLPPIMRIIT
jgi:hypothetical protein